MTTPTAAAVRSSRRRRRPPTPREWRAIFACSIYALLLAAEIWFWVADPAEPGTLRIVIRVVAIGGVFGLTWLVFKLHWPVVLNYIRTGYTDD